MKLYGLIGEKLEHSFSKNFFTEKFEKEGIDAQYELYELPQITEFPTLLANNEFYGLNVTFPYKEKVMDYIDQMDPEALEIGAINTIRFKRRGGRVNTKGYNTDVIGFTNSIRPLLQPHHKHALILGTGGASKAIRFALNKLGIDCQLVSRHAQDFPCAINYHQLTQEMMEKHEIIVNCSPLGMYPRVDVAPSIPYQLLNQRHLLFDLVYNPENTLFCQLGREHGATVKNGLEMLHGQALASWHIWNKD